jgi:hypothetical protein
MVTSLANFSWHPIQLSAGTLVGEVEEVEVDWTCTVISKDSTPEGMGLGQGFDKEESLYQGTLSWKPMLVAMDDDI